MGYHRQCVVVRDQEGSRGSEAIDIMILRMMGQKISTRTIFILPVISQKTESDMIFASKIQKSEKQSMLAILH